MSIAQFRLTLAFVLMMGSCLMPVLAQQKGLAIAGQATDLSMDLKLESTQVQGQEAQTRVNALESELVLKLKQQLGTSLSARADLVLQSNSYSFSDEQSESDEDQNSYSFEQLYIQHSGVDGGNRFRLGRQSLDDPLGWIIDEELDALRFTQGNKPWQLDLSISRQQLVLLGSEERDDKIDNVLAQLTLRGANGTRWSPYVLFRKDRGYDGSRASESTWLGLQGLVEINRNARYWLNAALRNGSEERDDGQRRLGGKALDAGLTWTFDSHFSPSFTLGYARASGDTDYSDSQNGTFRQSGLHSNKYELNGRSRFRYLGEVVDPELSNITIVTVGMGIRISKRWDLDMAFHRYTQVEPEDRLRGSDIDSDPAGIYRDLGDGFDIVLGYEYKKGLKLQGLAGLFNHGPAFEQSDDESDPLSNAWLTGLEIEYEF